MDQSAARQFFLQPKLTFQRQYEALRAHFVDGQSLDQVAQRFGYQSSALRSMASRFRTACRRGNAAPFFSLTDADAPPALAFTRLNHVPSPQIADRRELNLASGRTLRSRVADVFLFLPLLTRLGFDRIVNDALYPGSERVPAPSALLSLLALKLLDKERRSHIDDFNCDEALGLFAGLNILPKKSFATDYSYRTSRDQQWSLLQGWVKALAPVMFPNADSFALDFHPIPFRGDPALLDRHYLPTGGKAAPSVLTFFALEQDSRCFCYANADLTRDDQSGEVLRFVEFWRGITGSDPKWLCFDSKVTAYPELSRLNQRRIRFVTIRRRGTAILNRLERQSASVWKEAVIDIPKRSHTQIRYFEETVRLRGYEGAVRQIAVTGLGRDRPTLLLTNEFGETPRELIIRYAGRNRIEGGLGVGVNFFHLDCLASEVRVNVDLDTALTVVANGCYRWLASRLKGCEKCDPKQLFRRFVETAGTVRIESERLEVTFDRRSHNPILRAAGLERDSAPIDWLGRRTIEFS